MPRSRRRIEPNLIHPPTAKRWYCPRCGMVRPDLAVRRTAEGTHTVRRHYIYRPGPWHRRILPIGESLAREICPGGVIDPQKDRAP